MDYEKKYNEALKRARAYNTPIANRNTKAILESVFPELAESEDERIRKAVVSLVYEMKGTYQSFAEVELDKMVAWLEKQKEQNPAEWSEEDEVYLQDALWCVKQASKVARGENDMGACWSAERWLKSLRPYWKLSEELLDALDIVANLPELEYYGGIKDKIRELYKQLKKRYESNR